MIKRNAGIALLLVLWVIVLLIILLTQFTYSVRLEAKIAKNYKDELQAYYLAWAGIQYAFFEISQPYNNNILDENGNLVFVRPYTQLPNQLSPADNLREAIYPKAPKRKKIKLGNGYFSYTITDEDSKFNINSLIMGNVVMQSNVEFFRKLLIATGVEDGLEADTIVDSVLDWLDADDLHRLNGAEDDWYEDNYQEQGMSHPYKAKNGPFDTIEELLLVRGITPEIFYGSDYFKTKEQKEESLNEHKYLGLKNYITVYSTIYNVNSINRNTAPDLIIGLLMPENYEDFLQNRYENSLYRRNISLTFKIQSTGYVKNSNVFHTISVIVQRFNPYRRGNIRIKVWKDNAPFIKEKRNLNFNLTEDLSILNNLTK